MPDIAFLSASALLENLRTGKIGALELLDHYIQKIELHNQSINAVVASDYENARIRAKNADDLLAGNGKLGPLHGLPITVKESIAVAGMPLSGGSVERRHVVAGEHAEVVRLLTDAGAIVFGKTNLPTYGMDFQTVNPVYGQTNNPWDNRLTPGGSSGGAAAAVAAGLTAFDIGSDIGGSIRIPAHFCGIYGHKPSFNLVPLQGHFLFPGTTSRNGSMGEDMLVAGPLARCAADLEMIMSLIAAPDLRERTARRIVLPPPRRTQLKDYTIGLWLDDPAFPVDSRVRDRLEAFVDTLAKEVPGLCNRKPDIDFMRSHNLYAQLAAALNGSTLSDGIFEKVYREGQDLKGRMEDARAKFIQGATLLHRDWMLLNQERIELQHRWAAFFQEVDALLMPVTSIAAFPHDHTPYYQRKVMVNGEAMSYADTLYAWSGLCGVVYLPATVIPVGLNADGLPVGLQIVGPYLEDRTSMHVAKLIEEAMGGYVPPPAMVEMEKSV